MIGVLHRLSTQIEQMHGTIKILVLDIDSDDIQFQIQIESYCCKTSLDFYGCEDDFKGFGCKLTEFPKGINDTVVFELGERDKKWAYYMFIKAFCYDTLGHTALRIVVDNLGDNVNGHRSEFSIFSEVAAINSLGEKLLSWNPHTTKELVWESYVS